jgi:predicted RNase H-like nuclease (RuvC/YqgF family)
MYTNEVFLKVQKKTNDLLKFLETCKLTGSWDTKIDINVLMNFIRNYDIMLTNMRNNINDLKIQNEEKNKNIKIMEEKLKEMKDKYEEVEKNISGETTEDNQEK